MQRQYIVKLIGNVSDWLSYAGGALIKVADSAGSTVLLTPPPSPQILLNLRWHYNYNQSL